MTTRLLAETSSAPSLADRAIAAWAEEVAEPDAQAAKRKADELKRLVDVTVLYLHDKIGVDTGSALVEIEDRAEDAPRRFVVVVDGLRFTLVDLPYSDRYDRERLHVAVECARHCGKPLWVNVESVEQLGGVLQPDATNTHGFACLQQFDDDGEPTTDLVGNPLPPRQAIAPASSPEQKVRDSIAALDNPALVLAEALNRVTALEDNRALIKAAAIRRLVEAGASTSVTGAEKIVEQDEQYAQHRALQRSAEIEKHRALAAWESAKLTAQLDVGLAIADAIGAANLR